MTQEIKDLMQEKYNQVHNLVLQKCKEAKEQWLEEEYQEIERLKDQNVREMFKRIRVITGKMSSHPSTYIKSATGKILYEPEDVAKTWSKYLVQLFEDIRTEEEIIPVTDLSGPPTTKDEVRCALHKMKINKAAGPDEVVTEMLIALGEARINMVKNLVNKIYDSADMLMSVFIALPKKPNTMECDQHRTISLISHTLKLLFKIILERCRSN